MSGSVAEVAGPSFRACSLTMAFVQPMKLLAGGHGQFLNVTRRSAGDNTEAFSKEVANQPTTAVSQAIRFALAHV